MDPIDRLAKLMQALRTQQSSGPERARVPRGKGHATDNASARSPVKPSLDQLRRRIIERLRRPDGETGNDRAAHTFLEAVLAWEFGDELVQDPRFSEMVADVEAQLRSNPSLSASFDKLLLQLSRGE